MPEYYQYEGKKLEVAAVERTGNGSADLLLDLGRKDGERVRVFGAVLKDGPDYIGGVLPKNMVAKFSGGAEAYVEPKIPEDIKPEEVK